MKKSYLGPEVRVYEKFAFPAFAASGLTELRSCDFTGGCTPPFTGSGTVAVAVCAVGISDSSQLEGCFLTINFTNCSQLNIVIGHCTANTALDCLEGGLGVNCGIFIPDCSFNLGCLAINIGITTLDHTFVPCP